MDSLPRRLLVVAAHPDDDTIGCGGLMASAARAGSHVVALYVSDGRLSHPASVAWPPRKLAEQRETEARDALRELGIDTEPVFLRYRDGELSTLPTPDWRDACDRVAETIRAERPEMVLTPWLRDPHPDHMAAASITAGAVATIASERAGAAPELAFYEVWLPVRGVGSDFPQRGEAELEEFPLDNEIRARKRRALYAHRSQTSDLINDDPSAFRITEELASVWLEPRERIFRNLRTPRT